VGGGGDSIRAEKVAQRRARAARYRRMTRPVPARHARPAASRGERGGAARSRARGTASPRPVRLALGSGVDRRRSKPRQLASRAALDDRRSRAGGAPSPFDCVVEIIDAMATAEPHPSRRWQFGSKRCRRIARQTWPSEGADSGAWRGTIPMHGCIERVRVTVLRACPSPLRGGDPVASCGLPPRRSSSSRPSPAQLHLGQHEQASTRNQT
jgi:hypothetical protein